MSRVQRLKLKIKQPFDGILAVRPNPVVEIGAGKSQEIGSILNSLEVTQLFLVTDKGIRSLGLLEPILTSLDSAGIGYTIFDAVTQDPTYQVVEEGVAMLSSAKCNGVVAIGGGSVIDATKAMVASYDSKKKIQRLKGLYTGLLRISRKTPFLVVPTTAGTGSEATIVAVISDTETHQKGLVVSPKLVPDRVILDPEITQGLPPHLTASTGADALTHALEAYVSLYANKESSGYGEKAVSLIFKNLADCVQHPTNLEARENLLKASLYGGMAFTRAYVGYVHAFAHTIGGLFGIPHGLANGVLLPRVMRFYLPECSKKFAKLAELIGLPVEGLSEETRAEAFLDRLDKLLAEVGIPEVLKGFPESAVPKVVEMGFKECHATYPVPKYMSKDEATALLEKCAESAAQTATATDQEAHQSTVQPATSERPMAGVTSRIYLAGGCFWGVERFFQLVPGVTDTEVGYANGSTQNPTYQEVCHENTGHVECVKITYDSREISLDELLGLLYEIIDPTSLNRQGNDVGPQYRTGIYYVTEDQREVVEASLDRLQGKLGAGRSVMVETKPLENFFTAEQYHQKYLEKNPGGYCHISPRMFELAAEFKTKLDKDKR